MASLGGNQKMNVNSGVSTKVYFSEFSFFDSITKYCVEKNECARIINWSATIDDAETINNQKEKS